MRRWLLTPNGLLVVIGVAMMAAFLPSLSGCTGERGTGTMDYVLKSLGGGSLDEEGEKQVLGDGGTGFAHGFSSPLASAVPVSPLQSQAPRQHLPGRAAAARSSPRNDVAG